ncbi:Inositol phosphosphingolipids phospholipase C [Fulvia fulva]|uniref:Inositol phosphosphingolipids phospholipase C n=1 Tax=Passalora fulva TaxID=5499 RepID=A0A9Q8PFJ0_PASFU|nr:Inositol phosphosphingolipids phospholipase C [Fulvia fulva]KAK4613656.1 Inositol phosphosphingolipids phospholipase C [Fulvia fulva]KAK4614476.1 Inositol phosphosphingolipids phospholipase C [Fulvia fulva]UJO21487.1 Inositol phosphosphingolipids phospholipase C [Fulvia fulva]WPV19828.1 Inositol phosphosphingolipids phospholipase C [Fulvia fulva]WPV35143.1 Inositol phosphosphingolipids phospholipase C [Fulvia fulva]
MGSSSNAILKLPSSLRVVSLNCWGLKFISKFRHERLTEIGRQLAAAQPTPEIVGLQECWTQQDYLIIRELTKDILPYGKFYWSGVFGGGLAVLSKWPIEESSMYRYPLNGRPAAFWRGDWYVGKGVACARIRLGPRVKDVVEVFCTHLHAPYEREPNDSYICHRTAQAWEIAKLMRHASERGHMVLGLGDFNMVPMSLAHQLIEAHAPVRDVWRILYPESALGSAENEAEKERGRPVPSARECLEEHGATCDSTFNTWRWSKQMQKDLFKGIDSKVEEEAPDQKAKRLDYVFFADNAGSTGQQWEVESVEVGMTMRHPELKVSLSDHFSIETTLVRSTASQSRNTPSRPPVRHLDPATYQLIQTMIAKYDKRERAQRRLQLIHFWASLVVSIGCLTAVWWSPRNYVSFILMFISTLGLSSGVLDGLMGFLFVKTELRALKEFKFDIDHAASQAEALQGSRTPTERQVAGKLREVVRSREDEPDHEVLRP